MIMVTFLPARLGPCAAAGATAISAGAARKTVGRARSLITRLILSNIILVSKAAGISRDRSHSRQPCRREKQRGASPRHGSRAIEPACCRSSPSFVPAKAGTQGSNALTQRLGPHVRGDERREGSAQEHRGTDAFYSSIKQPSLSGPRF